MAIRGNTAYSCGGGWYAYTAQITLVGAVIDDNLGFTYGGGGYDQISHTSLTDTRMAGNLAGNGGALFGQSEGSLTLDHVRVVDNTATEYAGARNLYSNVTTVMTHVVMAGNSAVYSGGALQLGYTTLTMAHSALVGNVALTDSGGCLSSSASTVTLDSVIFAGCSASYNGAAIFVSSGDAPTIHYSAFWDNQGPSEFWGMTDPVGSDGNVAANPEFLDITALDAASWDLHLDTTSALIDAGEPASSDPDGGPADMGAYGGADADSWDVDGDGYPEWWLPGPYDAGTSPGMDCDDGDPSTYPGNGC